MYKNLKGLKFPDSAIINFFFKNGLQNLTNQNVLELACSNGNNLSLFSSYENRCVGVDINPINIQNGEYNFKNVFGYKNYEFHACDMFDFVSKNANFNADILLIPNVINYFLRADFLRLLRLLKENKIYKPNALFFLRTRSIRDFRYGIGKMVEKNCFKMADDYDITGEAGCLNTLYQEHELVEILQNELSLNDFKILTYESSNIMKNEYLINDSDIVIYGRILWK